jgi:mannosyltransferase OCH1-like enzyme
MPLWTGRPWTEKNLNSIIQGLWIGKALSVMERMSINSFLQNEHEYHLYCYETLDLVPEKAVIKDGNEILPASSIFQYSRYKSYSGFSNWFRYKLLFERGGWWADTDVICVKPFDFQDEYVFSSEVDNGVEVANSGIIKAPVGSSLMARAYKVCESKDKSKLAWGETGPRLLGAAVKEFGLEKYKRNYRTFCPIGYKDWELVLDPDFDVKLDDDTYGVHLWNEMWRRADRDKNARYHRDCLYERLKTKYLC